jgi:hypothetical protein
MTAENHLIKLAGKQSIDVVLVGPPPEYTMMTDRCKAMNQTIPATFNMSNLAW